MINNPEYFLAIAETRNITKAAEMLYISQPSLSQYLKKLENDLAVVLFERNKNDMRLTVAGEKYMNYIKRFSLIENEMRMEFSSFNCKKFTIRLGAHYEMGADVFSEIIPVISKTYPSLRFSIEECGSEKLLDMLTKQNLDVIIYHKYNGAPEIKSELLYKDSISLVVQKNFSFTKDFPTETSLKHPFFMDPSTLQEELHKHHFIYIENDTDFKNMISDYFAKFNIRPMKPLPVKDMMTALKVVEKGGGYAFIPNRFIQYSSVKDELAYLQISKQKIDWDLYVAYNINSFNFKSVQMAYKLIKDYYSAKVNT